MCVWSVWKRAPQRNLLPWFVFLFACQWCDETVMISAQPVEEPNMDADAGWSVRLKV